MRWATSFLASVALSALVLGSCGDDDAPVDALDPSAAAAAADDGGSDAGATPPANTDAAAAPEADSREAATSLGDRIPVEDECTAATAPFGLHYDVTRIPADDPDGGLVVRVEADPAAERVTVLVEGTTVQSLARDDTCERLGRGTWWWVATPGGAESGWVNAAFLTPAIDQPEIPVSFACALYDELLDARSEDRVPNQVALRLDAAFGRHPAGVSAALAEIGGASDPFELDEAYETVTGYVGPICEEVDRPE